MSPIKRRKHAVSRLNPTSALTAALFTGLAMSSLPTHAQSIGPAAEDDEQRRTTTLDKVEVEGHRERTYSGEVSSPKFTQPLVNTTQVRYAFSPRLRYSSAKAERELGYRKSPLEQAMRDALAWFREHKML